MLIEIVQTHGSDADETPAGCVIHGKQYVIGPLSVEEFDGAGRVRGPRGQVDRAHHKANALSRLKLIETMAGGRHAGL
jgi:hypothetical protein